MKKEDCDQVPKFEHDQIEEVIVGRYRQLKQYRELNEHSLYS